MKIKVFTQSAIRLEDDVVIYFDPFKIKDNLNDADYIFITHDHYDHYDEDSIKKVANEKTKLIVPECLKNIDFPNKMVVKPNEEYSLFTFTFKTVNAYNINKNYHPKEKNYVGYVLNIKDTSYYIMGDTDVTKETLAINSDVVFIPIGGVYTMDYKEAANYINKIKPQKAIPIHYGSIVGDISLQEEFKKLVSKDIEVDLYIKRIEK